MTEEKPNQQMSLMLPISTPRSTRSDQPYAQSKARGTSQADLAQKRNVLIDQLQKSGYVRPK